MKTKFFRITKRIYSASAYLKSGSLPLGDMSRSPGICTSVNMLYKKRQSCWRHHTHQSSDSSLSVDKQPVWTVIKCNDEVGRSNIVDPAHTRSEEPAQVTHRSRRQTVDRYASALNDSVNERTNERTNEVYLPMNGVVEWLVTSRGRSPSKLATKK